MTIMGLPPVRVRREANLAPRFSRPFSLRSLRDRSQRPMPDEREWRCDFGSARPAAPVQTGKAGHNAPLESLAGGVLAARFRAWRGTSGRRYICSVFPVNCAEADAGLSDFADALVIAVATDSEGAHRLVSIGHYDQAMDPRARSLFAAEAAAAGATEWHIHLLAADAMQRRIVMADIEAACCRTAAVKPIEMFAPA